MHRIAIAAFTLVVVLMALPARAGERPSADELLDRLKPRAEEPATRSLFDRGLTMEGPDQTSTSPSVDLEVNFEFNSAQLTTDAALTLDQLGRALNNPALVSSRFQVAGHTDGVGGDAFNQALSQQRAAAVRDYLVGRHGIAARRLEAVGYGKSRLLDPAHPDAAVNRRVQVTNISG